MIIDDKVQTNNYRTVFNTVRSIVKKQKGFVLFFLPKEETLITDN